MKVVKKSLETLLLNLIAFGTFSCGGFDILKVSLLCAFFIISTIHLIISITIEKSNRLPLGPHGEVPGDNFGMGNESLTEQQVLIEGFVNDILDYCSNKGLNCTIANEPDGLWLVNVDDEKNDYKKIINLTLPSEKDVTRENIKGLLKHMCDEIDVKIYESNK